MADESAATGPAPKTTVATYGSYREAERAVDHLSDNDFPVEKVAIVGTGLRTVEQVAGRITTGRATLLGAGQGALIGVFFALFLGLFFDLDGEFIGLLLYGLIVGAIFGATFGGITQAMQGGRRDFASVQRMEAERYELQVEHDHAARAKQLLGELPAT
jgi:hypothetical protein